MCFLKFIYYFLTPGKLGHVFTCVQGDSGFRARCGLLSCPKGFCGIELGLGWTDFGESKPRKLGLVLSLKGNLPPCSMPGKQH